jgi:hypothetical protein
MSEKNVASTLATSLVPLGALALAAGCGGGSAAVPNVAHLPGSQGAAGYNGPSVTAELTVTVPARGAQRVKRRNAQYISPGSGAIGVSVAVGATSPAPQQVFTLPTPGPAPVTTTLPVKAGVGSDTITVNVYDVSPAATASPNLLSTGSTQTTISPTALNTPSVTTLGVPGGVALAVVNNPSPQPSATALPWTPLEHAAGPQSVTIAATAVDALGYTITGPLATAAPIVATGPVTLSANAIPNPTATLTATYAQGATAAGTIGSSLPLNTANASENVAVQPDYAVFAADGNVDVVDGVQHSLTTSASAVGAVNVAAAACAGGAVAVAPIGNAVEITTVAPSTAANPVPTATSSSFVLTGMTASSAVTFDAACNAYFAVPVGSPATSFSIVKLSGFGGTVAASTIATVNGTTGGGTALTAGANLSVAATAGSSTLYIGEYTTYSGATAAGTTYTLPLPNGGTATQLDTHLAESVAVAGSTVYKTWDSGTTSCPFVGPYVQDLQAAQGALSNGTSYTGPVQPVLAANDGTLYVAQQFLNGGYLFSTATPLSGSTWASLSNSGSPASIALSPDPANTYLCESDGSAVAFYLRSQLGSSQTAATVATTAMVTGVAAAP